MAETLTPKSRQEAVAVFRHGVVGALTQAQMDHGALRAALTQLAHQRFRPPGAKSTRTYSVSTLERWYYRYRACGLDGLAPGKRSDAGRAQALRPPPCTRMNSCAASSCMCCPTAT